jgi:hypothetical protein
MKQTTVFDLPPSKLPYGATRFIAHWNSIANLRHHTNEQSKIYRESEEKIQKLTSGTLFSKSTSIAPQYKGKRFSFMHFERAVEVFSRKAVHYPTLSKMSLPDFLYNPFAEKNHSQFIVCLEESMKPKLHCENVELMNAIVTAYAEFSGSSKSISYYPQYILDLFAKAANMLDRKLKETKDQQQPLMLQTPKDAANLLLRLARSCAKGRSDKITPGYLASNWLEIQLIPFMKNQGYLKPTTSFSIYNRR